MSQAFAVLFLGVGKLEVAVPLERVRLVAYAVEAAALRQAQGERGGIETVEVHGERLRVLDLAERFGVEPAAAPLDRKLVVVSAGATSLALRVDRVGDAEEVPAAAVTPRARLEAGAAQVLDEAVVALLELPRGSVPLLEPRAPRKGGRPAAGAGGGGGGGGGGLDDRSRALLRRRAERLRAKPPAAPDEDVVWVAEFPIGGERYGIPIETLRAVVPLRMVTPVPLAPRHVIGILRFQGQMIGALGLTALLGVRGWREDPTVLLVVEVPGRSERDLVALDCEQIPRPSALPAAAVVAARGAEAQAVAEVVAPDGRRVHLIDLPLLLGDPHDDTRAGRGAR